MEADTDEEEMENTRLDDKRQNHWRLFFEDNKEGMYDGKTILNDKMWDVYTHKKRLLIKGGYSMEVPTQDGKKVIWEVVDDHVVEDPNDNYQIRLQGFGFNLFEI